MQKKKNLMRLKTRPYYALQGLVQTTGSAGGYDCSFSENKPPTESVE